MIIKSKKQRRKEERKEKWIKIGIYSSFIYLFIWKKGKIDNMEIILRKKKERRKDRKNGKKSNHQIYVN